MILLLLLLLVSISIRLEGCDRCAVTLPSQAVKLLLDTQYLRMNLCSECIRIDVIRDPFSVAAERERERDER